MSRSCCAKTVAMRVSENPTLLGSSVNRSNTPLALFNLTSERHAWFRIYERGDRTILWRGGRVVNAAGFKK